MSIRQPCKQRVGKPKWLVWSSRMRSGAGTSPMQWLFTYPPFATVMAWEGQNIFLCISLPIFSHGSLGDLQRRLRRPFFQAILERSVMLSSSLMSHQTQEAEHHHSTTSPGFLAPKYKYHLMIEWLQVTTLCLCLFANIWHQIKAQWKRYFGLL